MFQILLAVAAVSALWFGPATAVWAQAEKTVAVVSIESLDKLFADMDYLAKAADQSDAGNMAKGAATPFLAGIDKTKPIGVVATTDGDAFKAIAFIPVTDLQRVFQSVKIFPMIGTPEDAGGGVFKIGQGQPMFVKEAGGYAFIAQSPDQLSDLPADPTQWLDGLNDKYAIAVRGYMQGVPEAYRQMATGFVKEGMAAGMQRQPGEDDAIYAFRQKMATMQIEQIETLMQEVDTMTIGWGIDAAAQQTHLDVEVTAVPGTKLAGQMAQAVDATSKFAGFVRDGAAVTLHSASRISASDIETTTSALATFRDNTNKAIEKQNHGPAGEQALKDVVGTFFDVLDATVKAGQADFGATVLLGEKSLFAGAGLLVAEGDKMEDGLRKLAELAKDEPDFPGVKFDAESHAGVSFHTMAIPVPATAEQARAIFGETLDVVIGTSDSSFYLAAGNNASATLKSIIDDSANKTAVKMPPGQMVISLTPIMKFAAQFAPPAAQMAAMLEATGGKDHVSMVETAIENGMQMRITVEEGVIKAAGAAAGMFGGGGDFGPGPAPGPADAPDGF